MKNPFFSQSAKVKKNEKLTGKTALVTFDYEFNKFSPGQFLMLSISGFGEAPFGIMQPACENHKLQVLVNNVGALSDKIYNLKKNDMVNIRGPYGNGFPVFNWKNKNISMFAGGTGVVPIKALIDYISLNRNKFDDIQIFYGAKTPEFIFFQEELRKCKKFASVMLTVEQSKEKWDENTGLITNLITPKTVTADKCIAALCGPPIMYKFVIEKLKKNGFENKDIYVSLERRMRCGIGKCQHCTCGDKYVCLDGPVFSYDEVLKMPDGI